MTEDRVSAHQRAVDSKFFACQYGHPYPVDNCGWPMGVMRCQWCKAAIELGYHSGEAELIGGDDHKLLSTNYRIKKQDHDLMEELLQDTVKAKDDTSRVDAWRRVAETWSKMKAIEVPSQKRIDLDEFDPITLRLKRNAVIALGWPVTTDENQVHGSPSACYVSGPMDEEVSWTCSKLGSGTPRQNEASGQDCSGEYQDARANVVFEAGQDVDIDAAELGAVAPSVGARVDVVGRGMGVIALDNEDGTCNVILTTTARPTFRQRTSESRTVVLATES